MISSKFKVYFILPNNLMNLPDKLCIKIKLYCSAFSQSICVKFVVVPARVLTIIPNIPFKSSLWYPIKHILGIQIETDRTDCVHLAWRTDSTTVSSWYSCWVFGRTSCVKLKKRTADVRYMGMVADSGKCCILLVLGWGWAHWKFNKYIYMKYLRTFASGHMNAMQTHTNLASLEEDE